MEDLTLLNVNFESSIPYLHIKEISGLEKVNEHGSLTVKLELLGSEESINQIINNSYTSEVMSLNYKNTTIFRGTPQYTRIESDGNSFSVEIQLFSMTKKLDEKLHSRSFQKTNQTVSSITNKVIDENARYLNLKQNKSFDNTFFLQYQETDWNFLKRFAQAFETHIISDSSSKEARFWYGIKNGRQVKGKLTSRAIENNIIRKQLTTNDSSQENILQFKYFVSSHNYDIGDYQIESGTKFVVIEKQYLLEKGRLKFNYILVREIDVSQKLKQKLANPPVTLDGKVTAVEGTRVKVSLDIDEVEETATQWLEISSEGSNIFYYMPETGSRVSVQFSLETGIRPFVVSCKRSSIQSYISEMRDTETKVLSNFHGKKVSLSRSNLAINAGSVSIDLIDSDNIKLSSSGDINFSGKQNVNISSGGKVTIQASNSLIARSSLCSVKLATRVDFFGSQITNTSSAIGKAVHSSFEGQKHKKSKKRPVQKIQGLDKEKVVNQFIGLVPSNEPQVVQKLIARVPRTNGYELNKKKEIKSNNINKGNGKYRPLFKKSNIKKVMPETSALQKFDFKNGALLKAKIKPLIGIGGE